MLTPVSFSVGRAAEPRLSAPYVPGKRHDRFWTDAEDRILLDHYSVEGPAYCVSRLPKRDLHSVYLRARTLELKAPRQSTGRLHIGAAYDDAIREAWPTLHGRGAVKRLAQTLGVSRDAVSRRALFLGLTMPHRKEPPWTAAEDALLRKAPVNQPDRASAFFAAHGFKRSPAAIVVRCKRKDVSRRRRDVLSARSAAAILGCDSKVVAGWILDGSLAAEPRGTSRLSQQGGDTWSIQPADLRRFILDHLDRIDIRRVEKFAFVALLAGDEDDE